MKFNKTLVAVAIAGIASAPMIASADTTLSGAVQIKVQGHDQEGDAGDPTVAAGDVLFGIVSEHELNSGLTGYGSLRVDVDQLSNNSTKTGEEADELDDEGNPVEIKTKTAGSADNVYVGLKGGFGDFRMGEIPLAVEYGQVANDIFDVGGEISGGLSYTGSFGPVGLGVNYSPENNQDAVGIGAKFGIGGFSIGIGAEDRAESQNMAVGASFALAGASVAVHYWTQEVGTFDSEAESGVKVGLDDVESLAVKVGYGFGGVSAAVTFATYTGALGATDALADPEATVIRLDLGYGLGGGLEVSTRIDAITIDESSGGRFAVEDSTEDQVRWRIQLAKSF